jgi:MarR family transcriptional regulator, transcriptional regulator for hemolysin
MAVNAVAVKTEPEAECPQCFAGDLGWLLANANWALATEMTAALAPLGISGRAYHVLRAATTGEHTQKALAEMVGIDKTTMVVTVDELESSGLAERRPSPSDRRARVIAVTRAGRQKLAKADAITERVQAEVLGNLPASRRKALMDGLGTLLQGLMTDPSECAGAPRRREPRA